MALYRPGPLGSGMVKDFVDRKHGRKAIAVCTRCVDALLGDHVRRHRLPRASHANRSAARGLHAGRRRPAPPRDGQEEGRGDGRSKRPRSSRARQNNGVKTEDAERIFDLMEYFAGYGFNKSHSAAYALITYQTAYLKAHYPVELLCALMTADRDKMEKVVRIIAEGRAFGVDVLPPEINESRTDFTVVYAAPGAASAKGGQSQQHASAGCDGPTASQTSSIRRSASGWARSAALGKPRSTRSSRHVTRVGLSPTFLTSPKGSTRAA